MFGWFWDVLANTTASITFFAIFLAGTLFSAFSLVLGGHGDGDHDIGHDVGHDVGGHDVHQADGHHDGHDGPGGHSSIFDVGMLSVRGVALLCTGFGGVGLIAQNYTGKVLFSTLIGLLFGYVFAFGVLYVMKTFRSQQSNSLISMSDAVGRDATVATSIPANGPGEVRFELGGQEMVKMAYSNDGQPIRTGSQVRIDRVSGGGVVVSLSVK